MMHKALIEIKSAVFNRFTSILYWIVKDKSLNIGGSMGIRGLSLYHIIKIIFPSLSNINRNSGSTKTTVAEILN